MYTIQFTDIKLPPKIRKRGRPKGAETTVIGLPKRRKVVDRPLPFLKKLPYEREKSKIHSLVIIQSLHWFIVILQWFVDEAVAEAALSHRILVEEDAVEIRPEKVTPACLEPQVCVDVCRKYFTKDGWLMVKDVMATIESDPLWYCGRCSRQIFDETQSSIQCDSCLFWYHFNCIGINTQPKREVWFCTSCFK